MCIKRRVGQDWSEKADKETLTKSMDKSLNWSQVRGVDRLGEGAECKGISEM
jgi:hypothetical protein